MREGRINQKPLSRMGDRQDRIGKWRMRLAGEEMQTDPRPGDDNADPAGSALHDVRQHQA
jgi:hypothetical protein